MSEMVNNAHAEIVLITFGFAFIQIINFLARTAYAIKDAKIYKLKSLKIDFVVFVQLNEYIKRKIRGKRKIIPIDPEINPINYTIIPIKKIRSLITRRKKRSKSGNYSISLTSLYRNKTIKKYQNYSGWALIKKFLKIRG